MRRLFGMVARRKAPVVVGTLLAVALVGTAFASAPGTVLRMGVINTISGNYLTTFQGTVSSFVLYVRNNSAVSTSAAIRAYAPFGGVPLDLRAKAGQPPMRVNSNVKVSLLNADALDGVDSTTFLEGRVFRSGQGDAFPTLVAGSNYAYPIAAFTSEYSGTCYVNASSQLNGSSTGLGPYYRVAVKREGVDNSDLLYGHYFNAYTTVSGDITRHTRVAVTAGEALQFGAFFGSVTGDWVGDIAAVNVTYTCVRASGAGALSTSGNQKSKVPAGLPKQP